MPWGEVLRVPGNPQPEAQKVRGSWRDYLDPTPPDWTDTDCRCLTDSSEFEPFSDDELSDMDLALFEPASAVCCAMCDNQRRVPPPNMYIMSAVHQPGK